MLIMCFQQGKPTEIHSIADPSVTTSINSLLSMEIRRPSISWLQITAVADRAIESNIKLISLEGRQVI